MLYHPHRLFDPQDRPVHYFHQEANADNEHERFTHALVQELQTVAPHIGEIETIFIGGGTPTLLEDSLLMNVLETKQNTYQTKYWYAVDRNYR